MPQITIDVPAQHLTRLLDSLIGLFGSNLPPEAETESWTNSKKARWLHRWLLLEQVKRYEKSQAAMTHVAPITIDEDIIDPIT